MLDFISIPNTWGGSASCLGLLEKEIGILILVWSSYCLTLNIATNDTIEKSLHTIGFHAL